MKKLLFIFLIFLPLNAFSEEYLCSGIYDGTKTEIKSYERKEDYFLYTTRGWKFEILHEDDSHLMLGEISAYDSLKSVSLFLTIINKETLLFTERYVTSDGDKNADGFLRGNCIIK
ncbi:MAG: hypothetical protein ACJZ9K_05555 [Alphaproteobacteria bacterium]